jgi:ABC-2 type transport system permease protein
VALTRSSSRSADLVRVLEAGRLILHGPLLLIIYSVAAGASAIAGEEDRRTLDLLLASPVSHTRVIASLPAGGVRPR